MKHEMLQKGLLRFLIALIFNLGLIFNCPSTAQTPGFRWAKSIGGPGSDEGYSVAHDKSWNIYTTGYFNGTVDFDPGPGIFNLTSAGYNDIFISKLDSSGNFEWAKRMGGTSSDKGMSITTDASGNVYTTGFFIGTVDFDPGPGTFDLTAIGSNDIFISKLDSSGNFIWAKHMGGPGGAAGEGQSIVLDASGNVYITGYFLGTIDFDPGTGIFNLSTFGSDDVFISKLDSSGNFIWAKSMHGTSYGYGYSIAVDALGNVFTTGMFQGTVDFDPGTGTFNLTAALGYNIFISKLNSSGSFVWAKQIVADQCTSLALDDAVNVYTTGSFSGTVDFDPGPATFNLTAGMNAQNIFISKLDSSGNFIWAEKMDGGGLDYGNAIVLDSSHNIYVAGTFEKTVDFDPGPETFFLTSSEGGSGSDIFVAKLDNMGNFVWAKSIAGSPAGGGVSSATASSLTLIASDHIYFTGYFWSRTLFVDSTVLTNTDTSGNSSDVLIIGIKGINSASLNLTSFLQGFYSGGKRMVSTLYNLGFSSDSTATDTITVNLWAPTHLGNASSDTSVKVILHNNGSASTLFSASVYSKYYYIALKHRNSIETWSADSVLFSRSTSYDFSSALSQAYNDGYDAPMKNMGSGVYALYSGDVNQDGAFDALDMNKAYNDSRSINNFGYIVSDVNGDGGADLLDMIIIYNNVKMTGFFYARPY